MADNLQRQGGTYHVRLAIPEDVQQAFGNRRILSKSLGTTDRNEAMHLRLPHLAQWKAQIAQARLTKVNRGDAWKDEAQAYALALTEHARNHKIAVALNEPVCLNESTDLTEALREALFSDPDYSEAFRQLVHSRESQGTDGQLALMDDLRVMAGALFALAIEQKEALSPPETEELAEIFSSPSTYKPKSPITPSRLKSFRLFRESHKIEPKTIDQQESKLRKLSAYLAETGSPLDFDTVASFLDSLKLTSKTLNQYLLAGSKFWQWVIKYDPQWREEYKGLASPFTGHDLPKLRGKALKDAKRQPFKSDELPKLYKTALSVGDTALSQLIQLGAYSGARIEELCQLKTTDIIMVDGISCFDITDSKTKAGIRQVPVHPALQSLVNTLISQSEDGMLIATNCKNKYGVRSSALSKRFGRLKEGLGYGPQHVFHSIRMTVITSLHRADVPRVTLQEIVGHETGMVTFDIYSDGTTPAQKLLAISNLSYVWDSEPA